MIINPAPVAIIKTLLTFEPFSKMNNIKEGYLLTAILPALIGSILVILVLAALIRPLLKSRPVKKPLAERALFRFNEEYSVELTDPVKPLNEEMVPELPRSYGIDRMVLLVRDPYWLY
ncbi:MAG: hypothetical protein ACYDEQ_14720, partial [Desulfocucumaceae bacterium]